MHGWHSASTWPVRVRNAVNIVVVVATSIFYLVEHKGRGALLPERNAFAIAREVIVTVAGIRDADINIGALGQAGLGSGASGPSSGSSDIDRSWCGGSRLNLWSSSTCRVARSMRVSMAVGFLRVVTSFFCRAVFQTWLTL